MSGHGLMTNNRNLIESNRTGKMRWSVTMLLPLAVCVLLGSGVLGTARSKDETVPNEIRARKFVVVDDTGKERAEFGIMENGETGMVVWNKNRSAAVSVSMDRFGMPRIVFENSKSEALLELGILEDRFPAFVMRDANGRRRLAVMATEGEAVAIGLYDTKKRNRCAVSLGRDGHPQITLKDDKGQVRVRLMLDNDGTCALDFLDGKGNKHIVFQVDAQGQADAAVFGPDGKATWSAGEP